ncbi:MAG: hypothetical protein M1531_02275 [Chloroflexi bacterium]|nr:hypothetical protein [Chloroflexota bacterium]
MSYDDFQRTVAQRYFSSDRRCDNRVRGKTSLDDAARAIWPDLSEQEAAYLRERLANQLENGSFHYLVVAQRFTPAIEQTAAYLNSVAPGPRFYGIELVRFTSDGITAFESRTVLRPKKTPMAPPSLDETRFLESIHDPRYRDAIEELFAEWRALGLRLDWGTSGTSIRAFVADRREPVSIGWLFRPGVSGWMGMTDLALGVDTFQMKRVPSTAEAAIEEYLRRIELLQGVKAVKVKGLRAFHLSPALTVENHQRIVEIITELLTRISEAA